MTRKLRKAWEEYTLAQQRVIVAKDTLSQVLYNKAIAVNSGDYCQIYDDKLLRGKQLNQLLPTLDNYSCSVCAKGALFLAHVDRFNALKVKHNGEISFTEDQISKRLNNIFEQGQLDVIECAFEKDIIRDHTHILYTHYEEYSPLAKKAIKFGERFKSNKNRLVAILENMIKNKGMFIP